jgi:hypothetical protein
MRETKSKVIGDTTYFVTQLGAKDARRVGRRLARIFGVAAEADNKIGKFFDALSDDEFDFLCDTFAKTTLISPADSPLNPATGQPQVQFPLVAKFDDHFAGHMGLMVQWLRFGVEVNFGSFLDELGPEMRGLLLSLDAPGPTTPKPASIGSSGASSARALGAS